MLEPVLREEFATLADAMDAAAEQLSDVEAYVEGERRWTFSEWLGAADALAARLVERGVRPGDVVAIVLPPSIEFAVALGGIVRAGAVATGLNVRLGPREVEGIVGRCQPVLAFVTADRPSGLGPEVPTIGPQEMASALSGPGLGDSRPHRGATDPVVIVWTSGTTGMPKGAWFDHDNLRAAVRTAGVMTAPFDRRLASTPFAHAGYMVKLWEQLAWATTLVISPTPWNAADMLRLIVDERITVAGGAPTQWARFLELPGVDGADFSSLRLGIAATAPAPPELVAQVQERCGCPLVVRYAMTESPSISGTEPEDDPDVLYRTVGRPQAGIEVAIRDEAGRPVDQEGIGRIYVRGPCVMRGYWQEPELTGEVLTDDGWLASSDLGHRDPSGNLVLAGRLNDMYIRGGYNVHPLQVEHVLDEHPGVRASAVIGVPAPGLGEIGVAFVVPSSDAPQPTLDELRAWCKERLADYKRPDRLVLVDALPLTSMMKVDKAALARLL